MFNSIPKIAPKAGAVADPSAPAVKPFLIAKGEDGDVRLTLREVRRNSQDYPWVFSTVIDEVFATTAAARAYAVEHHGAKTGDFATR